MKEGVNERGSMPAANEPSLSGVVSPVPVKPRKFIRLYLLGAVISGVVAIFSAIPCIPMFIYLSMPFPELSTATPYTGVVEIRGKAHFEKSGMIQPRYFMVNESGEHEFFCGYLGDRKGCFLNDEKFDGATGTVWLHPIFGVLQMELIIQKGNQKGRAELEPYSVTKNYFENQFKASKYFNRFLIFIGVIAVMIYQLNRYFVLRKYYGQIDKGSDK